MKPSFRNPSGFTLVEMIVAVAISVAIAAVLISVATTALGVWNRSNARWATAAVANAVLDQVQSDLTSATFQSTGGTELAVQILWDADSKRGWDIVSSRFPKPRDSDKKHVVVTDSDITKCRFGAGGSWLRLFVGTSGDTTKGSNPDSAENRGVVRAVSYQIVRRYQTGERKELAYLLLRAEAGDWETFDEGYDFDEGEYANVTNPSGDLGEVGNLRKPNLVQALADHVADFGVRFYSVEGGRLVPQFPASGGAWSDLPDAEFHVQLSPGGVSATPVPAVAEVMVRLITEEGVQKLRLYENPPSGISASGVQWWDIVEQHSHVYMRRFWIGNRGP